MTIIETLQMDAVSQFTVYGATSHDAYYIAKQGIKFNTASERSPHYGCWVVRRNPFSGTGAFLLKDGEWMNQLAYNNKDENAVDCHFATADAAFQALKSAVSEDLII